MRDQIATVVEIISIQKNYFFLKIRAEYVSRKAKPGNFIMLRVSPALEPLLRRPFGIFDAVPPYIWIYFEVVGRGTRFISNLRPGAQITILGPLGNSFPQLYDHNILAIAGGRGIAPIHFALKEYSVHNKVKLVYGAGSDKDLNLVKKLGNLPLDELRLYTNDGSAGKKGLVTSDIRHIIQQHRINVTVACGPSQMLKTIFELTRDLKIRNFVSLEALMGCGFGICHSCAVPTRGNGYQKICSKGPVFKMEEIAW